MTFAEPAWFTALLLVPVLCLCMWCGDAAVRQRLERLVAPRLRSRLVEGVSETRRWLKRALLLMALTALVVALARPQWGYTERPVARQGRDDHPTDQNLTARGSTSHVAPPQRRLRSAIHGAGGASKVGPNAGPAW